MASASEDPWNLPDDKLLAECRVEAYVGSGPGGQHRNRTCTAIRITHLPSGIAAVAADSRSQRDNRIHALRHLRHKLAMASRHEPVLLDFHPPAYFAQYPGLHMSPKNPLYAGTVAIVLDVLKAAHWNIAHAAVMLGLTTSALVRFLHDDPPLWTSVCEAQRQLGIKPMKWR
jgi:hypothetical protein